MTLEQALDVLGPERVRKGMRAIDDRRPFNGINEECETCFVGEAFEGDYDAPYRVQSQLSTAACVVEAAYEGFWSPAKYTRTDLRTACVVYLAEHGEAVEPSVLCPAVPERI